MLWKFYIMNLNFYGVIVENYYCVVLCVVKKKLIVGNVIRDSIFINYF